MLYSVFYTVHLCLPNGNPLPVSLNRQTIFTDCDCSFPQTTVKKREMMLSISSLVRMWKICPSSPGCSLVWTLRVLYFPVTHCIFRKLKMNIPILWLNSLHKHIRNLCCFVPLLRANTFTPYIIILGLRWNVETSVRGQKLTWRSVRVSAQLHENTSTWLFCQ